MIDAIEKEQAMTKTNKKEAALDAYMARHANVRAMLARLTAEADDHFGTNPDTLHWGHVGDIGGIEEQLQRICDQVFKEGEHAPQNN